MAARKAKRRAPLVESDTEEALRRRGAELLGLILIGLGALAFALVWTYSPDDPSLFSATDESPRNALGLVGASLADPLHRALGWAAYGPAVALAIWGLRLLTHVGEARAARRAVLTPLALLAAAAFAATHVPLAGWPHGYGLGGLLGDAALGGLLSVMPFDVALALTIASVALALAFTFSTGYALGVTWGEFTGFLRFVRQGSVLVYAGAHDLTGRAVASAAEGARSARDLAAEHRARRAELAAPPLPAPRPGGIPRFDAGAVGAPQDRVMARITAAIRARSEAEANARPSPGRPVPPLTAADTELAVMDRDPVPLPDADALPELRVQQPSARPLAKSARARSEEQPELALDADVPIAYRTPPLSLLQSPSTIVRHHLSNDALEENARMLETVLDDYGVRGEIVSIRPGPVVTMYELEPAAGLKASRVIGLADDIARSMSALACRVSTIPGRSVIGIELPNELRERVLLREILSAKAYGDSAHALPLALGKDIGGEPVVANLARMPHLLIAGTTGSGKSVAINTMILSLLYKLSPAECRLIMIDPKMLELSVYDGIPHLLSPVVTDPKKAVVALKWTVAEMEERYRKMSKLGVRNIDGYNARVTDAQGKGEAFTRTVQTGFDEDTGEPVFETEEFQPEAMPFIVVIVDEMADLMMVAGKEIEACIQRLAQMARASGIHLIMATQRPSVDVITGTIKANFPTRISFQVTSKIDSRTILGEMGAEQLLGQGDMLYMAGGGRITRVHGPFVSDEEVEEVVRHLKTLGAPDYDAGVIDGPEAEEESEIDLVLGLGGNTAGDDLLYDQAVAIVAKDRKCSTSYIQRKLSVGYNKAAKLVELMEEAGVVSQANHVGKREVLVPER
jgi:S-DNA-T family DNA segregation ATPase FtsK/SpoIIIE